MKKIAVVVFLFAIAVTDIFGAEVTSRRLSSRLNNYIKTFSDGIKLRDAKKVRIAADYYKYTQGNYKNAVAQFAQLDEDPNKVDTAVEWLYTSYYFVNVRDIRPPEADAILPANNPKLVDLELGAVTMQEIKINQFLGNTDTAGRYEGVLKFITDRGNATRAEIETFYCNGIRGLIAEIVDEEFNKISFKLENISLRKSYNAVLIRDIKTAQYKLSYEDANNETREIKDMPTINALLAEMGRRTSDFDQTGINQVSAQARLIPAVTYPVSVLNDVVNIMVVMYKV
jgi:hypothetical protein